MRISLLDPQWKEQKQIEVERRKESNVASGEAINSSLRGFAARRTDIFGDQEVGIGEVVDKRSEQRSKQVPSKVIWDGHSSSIARRANVALATNVPPAVTMAPPS